MDIDKLKTDIEAYYKKQNTLYRFKSKLTSEIYQERWGKVLFYLIEYFYYKDKEDYEIFEQNEKKIQLEHIFPQNDKNWEDIVSVDPVIKELKNTLGNLTLLYQSKNVKCSNSDFATKLTIYKDSQKFNHTKELLNYSDWNSRAIIERQRLLLEQIEKIFDTPQ